MNVAGALSGCKELLAEDSRFAGCQELSTGESAVMWAANGSDAINIKYIMTDGADMGWMGLGLNVHGSMKGADMWVVHRQGQGWAVTDARAVAFAHPLADTSQDVVLRSMDYKDGIWSAVLSRKLKPCDLAGDYEIVPGQQFVMLWAHGMVATRNFAGVTYHGLNNRGSVDVALLTEQASPTHAAVAEDSAAAAAPSEETEQQQQQQQPPAAQIAAIVGNFMRGRENNNAAPICLSPRKYHIIGYESIWRSSMVHHSLTYACQPGSQFEADAKQLMAVNGTGPYDLDSHIKKCSQLYMVAPHRKAPPTTLPQEAGLPMGKGSFSIFLVEMHYYNPTAASGKSDPGSGLRLKFQPASVRGVDAGFLTVGQFDLNIPPGQPTYVARTATCTPGCTKRFTQNLTIIRQMVHGHYLSKTFRTGWVRNGVELKPLATMKLNDFNFQSWLPTDPNHSTLMPGDQLTLTCVYNSRGRTNVTKWGWGAREEMCFWFIMYYPAQPVAFCAQGFNDLLPMTVCTDTTKDITAMYEPYYVTNNLTQVLAIVSDAIKAGRAIMPDPIMKIDKPYNLAQGCSATKPL
uniref:DOMON domain-containing protein n=1 Tax=Tetradesmus obliquus TaxID=3088 RepID=A0A383W8T0_TETOB|eukprot:jgi/Sobl393_1/15685/SZX73096.1